MPASESANLLNRFCEEFELAWSTGDQPSISEFSGRIDEHLRDELITRLITLDIKCRQRLEVSVSVEDYRALGTEALEFAKGIIDEAESGDEPPISLPPDIDSPASDVQQSNPILESTISVLANTAATQPCLWKKLSISSLANTN